MMSRKRFATSETNIGKKIKVEELEEDDDNFSLGDDDNFSLGDDDNGSEEEEGELEEDTNDDITPSLTQDFHEKVRPFIDLIDRLRHFGLEKDVGLPTVVVIGDQSAGKSSTLEAISGVQLPRGSGIVTRCPLQLRLKSHSIQNHWKANLSYKKDEKVVKYELKGPEEVGDKVLEAQNALAGKSKCISPVLITLEIEAYAIPDLTLIDLPGIIRVSVKGQPDNTSQQIRSLIKNYVVKPETIILAVVPANQDIATTEALKLAQDVDPDGLRTLGVVTKPDLIDKGTESELIQVVNNQSVKLTKGYTVVKCRSQDAIKKGQTLTEAMREEEAFFQKHESLRELSPLLCGISNLSKKLTEELVNQIKKNLPSLKEEVTNQTEATQSRLNALGSSVPTEDSQKTSFLIQSLDDFVSEMTQLCKGEYDNTEENVRLYTSARRCFERLSSDLNKEIPETKTVLKEIRQEIDSQRGCELPKVWKFSILKMFIKRYVEDCKKPATACISDVNSETEKVIDIVAKKELGRFPDLLTKAKEVMNTIRKDAFHKCQDKVEELFEMENLVFTQDETYLEILEQVERQFPTSKIGAYFENSNAFYGQSITPTRKQEEALAMYKAIFAYIKVAKRRMLDTIPMICIYQMLEQLSVQTKRQILTLGTQESSMPLLREDTHVAVERNHLQQKIRRLNDASIELGKF